MPAWTDDEKRAIRFLCQLFEGGHRSVNAKQIGEELEVSETDAARLLHRFEGFGLVTQERMHSAFISIKVLRIEPVIVPTAASLDEQIDRVDQLWRKARAHPVCAFFVVAFFVLTAIATLWASILTILENLRGTP